MSSANTKILVIGSGAREHAIAWRLSLTPGVKIWVAPGNDGMFLETPGLARLPDLSNHWIQNADYAGLAQMAKSLEIDLTVVGPDQALADGCVDQFEALGLKILGPTKAASQLEWSKSFAKEMMIEAKVPTARFFVVGSKDEAQRAILEFNGNCVVKADGLALGKGVEVCDGVEAALNAFERLSKLGSSFAISQQVPRVVIEERLFGEELSVIAICDGERAQVFPCARDYKQILEEGKGPNTGGMGAICPVPRLPEGIETRVLNEVFLPTLALMRKRGTPFKGFLYAGLMWNRVSDSIWVIEFNSRLGDPEAQVLLPRFSGDFVQLCKKAAEGKLEKSLILPSSEQSFVYVVAAASGYPESPIKGTQMNWGPNTNTTQNTFPTAFVAGVVGTDPGSLKTSGGRVFGSLGVGDDREKARLNALRLFRTRNFDGMQIRKDVGLEYPGIVVMASGRGSNFKAILEAVQKGQLHVKIKGLISDKADAGALDIARENNIPAFYIDKNSQTFPSGSSKTLGLGDKTPGSGDKNTFEKEILNTLTRLNAEWIVLAGFMRILSPQILKPFLDSKGYYRVVNVHPSLLPDFKGKNGYSQAHAAGVDRTGVTVHLVDEGLDSGLVLAQKAFSIAGKTLGDIEHQGLEIEHQLYPETLEKLIHGHLRIEKGPEGKLRVCKD